MIFGWLANSAHIVTSCSILARPLECPIRDLPHWWEDGEMIMRDVMS